MIRACRRSDRSREENRADCARRLALRLFPVTKLSCQFAAILVFEGLQLVAPEWWGFEQLRRISYDQSRQVTGEPGSNPHIPKVAVVDISRLQRVDADGTPGTGPFIPDPDYTPRLALRHLLERLQSFNPKAVGFDVDFSPDPNSGTDKAMAGEIPLFELAVELSERGIPVFMGVGRGFLAPDKAGWLGRMEYADLAASIILLTDEQLKPALYSLIPSSIEKREPDGRRIAAPLALSEKLAAATPETSGRLPWWSRPFFSDGERITRSYGSRHTYEIEAYRVDFRPSAIIQLAAQTVEAQDLWAAGSDKATDARLRPILGESIVLFGATSEDRTADKIIVPGAARPMPGVYVHALGTLTLLHGRFTEIKPWLSLLGGVALTCLIGWLAHALLRREWVAHPVRSELIELGCTCVAIFFVSWFLAAQFRILWPAWIAAVLGAGFETWLKLFVLSPVLAPVRMPPPSR